MLGAAGAIEFVAGVVAIKDGFIPPTLNFTEPLEDYTDLNFVPNKSEYAEVNTVVSNSFGFWGNCCSIVFSILVPSHIEQNSHISSEYAFDGFRPQGHKGAEYYSFKDTLTEKILKRADEVYPGISSHVVVKDLITPATIERTTLNYQGSTLGVKAVPELEGTAKKRFNLSIGFKMQTAINRLFLAGGWTESGFSASAVISSGRDVAFKILGKTTGSRIIINPQKRLQRIKGHSLL
jgi:phytoene dehydrogenase-like protein